MQRAKRAGNSRSVTFALLPLSPPRSFLSFFSSSVHYSTHCGCLRFLRDETRASFSARRSPPRLSTCLSVVPEISLYLSLSLSLSLESRLFRPILSGQLTRARASRGGGSRRLATASCPLLRSQLELRPREIHEIPDRGITAAGEWERNSQSAQSHRNLGCLLPPCKL